ncbi:hypothetical protein ACOIP5_005721, partial [Salmonella enterica]
LLRPLNLSPVIFFNEVKKMNTEITIKHTPLIRSGYHSRGFASANTITSIPLNKISKHAAVKYKGTHIGRIDGLYPSDLRDGRVELHGNITFTGSLTTLEEMVKDKALYPVCVINTAAGPNQSWLSEVFFATEEDREFDEQEPINLKDLLNLASLIAKPEAPESAVIFNKKYDNEKTGFAGYVNINEEKPSNYYDIKENNAVITFGNEGEDIGNGIMRYGHYCNGTLMGYVACGVTEFGGDYRPTHPLDILEKFVEHQRNKRKKIINQE